jgi:hypothetical protein
MGQSDRASMGVPMVCVRKVLVRVGHRDVTVAVGMSPGLRVSAVLVLVMHVMFVFMFVLNVLMRVNVRVVLGQMQPDTQGHEPASHQKRWCDGFAQPQHSE